MNRVRFLLVAVELSAVAVKEVHLSAVDLRARVPVIHNCEHTDDSGQYRRGNHDCELNTHRPSGAAPEVSRQISAKRANRSDGFPAA
jgi:hypothetical protein